MQLFEELLRRAATAAKKKTNYRLLTRTQQNAVLNNKPHASWRIHKPIHDFSRPQTAFYCKQVNNYPMVDVDLSLKTIFSIQQSALLPRQQLLKGYLLEALQNCAKLSNNTRPMHCFISYAWESQAHQQWVDQFAEALRAAGIKISLDQDLKLGKSIPQFMKKIILEDTDYVLLIATPGYLQRYQRLTQADSRDSGIKTEMRLIEALELFNEQQGKKIIPLMLAGDEKTSLPLLMRGKLYQDFINGDPFKAIFEVVRHLLNIDRHKQEFTQITGYFFKQLELLKSMPPKQEELEIITLQKSKDVQERATIEADLDQRLQQLLVAQKGSPKSENTTQKVHVNAGEQAEQDKQHGKQDDKKTDANAQFERAHANGGEKVNLNEKQYFDFVLYFGGAVFTTFVSAIIYLYKHLNEEVLPEQSKKIEQQVRDGNDYLFKLIQTEGNRLGIFERLDYLYLSSKPTDEELSQHLQTDKMLNKFIVDTEALQHEFSEAIKYWAIIMPHWLDNLLFNQAIGKLQVKLTDQLEKLNLMLNSNKTIYKLKTHNYPHAEQAALNAINLLLQSAKLHFPGVSHDDLLANHYNLSAKIAAAKGDKLASLEYYDSAIKYSQEPGLYNGRASLLIDMARLKEGDARNLALMATYINAAIKDHQYAVAQSRNYPEVQKQQYAADYAYGLYVLWRARGLGYQDETGLKDKKDNELLALANYHLGDRMDPSKLLPYVRPNHYVFSGIIAQEQGNLKLAIKLLDKALELNSHYLTALYRKGMVLRLMGECTQALQMLTTARLNAEASKDSPDIKFWLNNIDVEIAKVHDALKTPACKK